jgi:hypothetical protein
MKTENPSACATVNREVCKITDSDVHVLPVVPSCVNKVPINPNIQSQTRCISHEQNP